MKCKYGVFLFGGILTVMLSLLRGDEIIFTDVAVEGHKGYVISKDQSTDIRDDIHLFFTNELGYGKRFSGIWTPTADDVAVAEKSAWKLVEHSPTNPVSAFPYLAHCKPGDKAKMWRNAENEAKLVNDHRGKYDAQYIGILLDGKKQIFCNYFILFSDFHMDPTTRLVDVNDGGWNYWQVLYDVKAKTSSNLQINGPWELDW